MKEQYAIEWFLLLSFKCERIFCNVDSEGNVENCVSFKVFHYLIARLFHEHAKITDDAWPGCSAQTAKDAYV